MFLPDYCYYLRHHLRHPLLQLLRRSSETYGNAQIQIRPWWRSCSHILECPRPSPYTRASHTEAIPALQLGVACCMTYRGPTLPVFLVNSVAFTLTLSCNAAFLRLGLPHRGAQGRHSVR
ncbi:hypothetical protein GY45DRAFT_36306 [Cubamyces sp. BRFM 1775]|nr:hypothetical protein GY45DRAFT_36306 [Cubamyces sp. BRFM 1775]